MTPCTDMRRARKQQRVKGSALLAVLWLSAALAAISFSVASSVRGETERVATSEEDVRAAYIASGAVERAILHMQWAQSSSAPDGSNPYYTVGQPRMMLDFPEAQAVVDVIAEASKIDINYAPVELLAHLMLVLGAEPERAEQIALAIADWREPSPKAGPSGLDQFYLSLQPSFRARHASIEDVEELLSVQGMTPDLFYGTWVRQAGESGSRLVPRGGARECLSPFGGRDRYEVNTVPPAVLLAAGASPEEVQALVNRRNAAPISRQQDLAAMTQSSPNLANHLSISSHNVYTFRATVRLRRQDGSLSDMKRSVSALVRFFRPGNRVETFRILRWYDRG
jgi:general secretion pathway protein K